MFFAFFACFLFFILIALMQFCSGITNLALSSEDFHYDHLLGSVNLCPLLNQSIIPHLNAEQVLTVVAPEMLMFRTCPAHWPISSNPPPVAPMEHFVVYSFATPPIAVKPGILLSFCGCHFLDFPPDFLVSRLL